MAIVPLADGLPDCDAMTMADLTGLAALAGDDPEPEFVDINAALSDISKYRQEAIPQMAAQIVELNELAASQEQAISQMERGNAQAGDFVIEVE